MQHETTTAKIVLHPLLQAAAHRLLSVPGLTASTRRLIKQDLHIEEQPVAEQTELPL